MRYSRRALGTRRQASKFTDAQRDCFCCPGSPHDYDHIFYDCSQAVAIRQELGRQPGFPGTALDRSNFMTYFVGNDCLEANYVNKVIMIARWALWTASIQPGLNAKEVMLKILAKELRSF